VSRADEIVMVDYTGSDWSTEAVRGKLKELIREAIIAAMCSGWGHLIGIVSVSLGYSTHYNTRLVVVLLRDKQREALERLLERNR